MWKFKPIFKPTIWGGTKIAALKGVHSDLARIGESWEISAVPGSESIVSAGPDEGMTIIQLIEKYGPDLMGNRNYEKYGNRMPLLVKIIDANADLSVQVHPDDDVANAMGMPNGKTEMWYIIDAEKDARIALGLNRSVSPEEFRRYAENGSVEDVIRYCPAAEGDTFFIPAGRIHTICGGLLLVEIQQTSDATFRIYDYGRTDESGALRPLQIEEAIRSINFDDVDGGPNEYNHLQNIPVRVVESPYFTTNILDYNSEVMRNYSEVDSFVVIIAVKGSATLISKTDKTRIRSGESVLVAAAEDSLIIEPDDEFKAVETFID